MVEVFLKFFKRRKEESLIHTLPNTAKTTKDEDQVGLPRIASGRSGFEQDAKIEFQN